MIVLENQESSGDEGEKQGSRKQDDAEREEEKGGELMGQFADMSAKEMEDWLDRLEDEIEWVTDLQITARKRQLGSIEAAVKHKAARAELKACQTAVTEAEARVDELEKEVEKKEKRVKAAKQKKAKSKAQAALDDAISCRDAESNALAEARNRLEAANSVAAESSKQVAVKREQYEKAKDMLQASNGMLVSMYKQTSMFAYCWFL